MDDEPTDAEAIELFERTQHIGDAIHTLAEAELTVAAVDRFDPARNLRMR